MLKRGLTISLLFGITLFLLANTAFADIGVPMVCVTLPYMVIALIPVIIIEGYVLRRQLIIKQTQAYQCATISNLLSTFVGIPLTWICLVIIQLLTGGDAAYGVDTWVHKFLAVTWQAPWLIPYENHMFWMIPTAMLVLLIPFFFISFYLEYIITARILNKVDKIEPRKIKKAVFMGNLLTYSLLALTPLTLLICYILR